ncbi:type II toxin-antitoxin system VapC family toxin [uncultured Friedmanniella sp.]|uniref:type II toxin-antitoxin system VapC family toxin n=1 Tax=uncultured Friedmanniella sp. TaxID=335381 RepID=UPI0035CA0586
MIPLLRSIVLDAEALSALAQTDRRMQVWAAVAKRTGATLAASTLTLAEITDGSPRDANVRRIVKAVRFEPVTDALGYRAGELGAAAGLLPRKPRDLTVDAVVAATALAMPPPVVVLTSDPDDLKLLLTGTKVDVHGI